MKKLMKEPVVKVDSDESSEEVQPKTGSAFAAFAVDESSDTPSEAEEEEVKVVEPVKSKKKRNRRKKGNATTKVNEDDQYLDKIVEQTQIETKEATVNTLKMEK